jgi:hypothetical protein
METQQFHLKWNNHSLNTLSSFQQLLDTNTLVDVSLTCSNGKTVTAHRMVLAACSDYFYRLFKGLPEKHPVIVFKDAGEEIVRDLLLFMYRGEVEVQESSLNDFLKFADTLQVKGLSQSDREEQAKNNNNNNNINNTSTPRIKEATPLSLVKAPPPTSSASMSAAVTPPPSLHHHHHHQQPPMSDLAKSYLAGLTKFPPIFPHLPTEPLAASSVVNPADLFGGLGSPNLYRALQRKYPDNPVLLKQMPFLQKMFGEHPDFASALLYPPTSHASASADDSDSVGDRNTPPPMPLPRTLHDDIERPLAADSPYPPSSGGPGSASGDHSPNKDKNKNTSDAGKHSGRGSRLERMIAAEYKIMNEYTDHPSEMLPVMTPELMKSRRTHSLQLAIAEIMHNRASVQSAATKYHIPRETLRRHYQRYLKAMGIEKKVPDGPGSGSNTPISSSASSNPVRSNNNNSKDSTGLPRMLPLPHPGVNVSGLAAAAAAVAAAAAAANEDGSNGFSSLMDIGAAYGIWNPDVDGVFKHKKEMSKEDKEDREKLVIDEDEEEEEEPLSPGGPEEEMETSSASIMPPLAPSTANSKPSSTITSTASSAASIAPMETSA